MTRRKPKRPPEVAGLALDAKLDVTRAHPLASAVLGRRGADLAIDASAVEHLGAQCAQVLIAARRTWQSDGLTVQIAPQSEAFVEGVRLLGLQAEFEN